MWICKPFPFVALLRQTVDFCCNELIGVGWSAESSIKADLLADNFFEAQKNLHTGCACQMMCNVEMQKVVDYLAIVIMIV